MTKTTKTNFATVKLDVAGVLHAVQAKKSREQVKAERLLPFIPVNNAALESGWKWSPIATLIRGYGGPSLSKQEEETLYEQIKDQDEPDGNDGDAEEARRAKDGDAVTCSRCGLPSPPTGAQVEAGPDDCAAR